jgi:hypothetical protein
MPTTITPNLPFAGSTFDAAFFRPADDLPTRTTAFLPPFPFVAMVYPALLF